MTTMGLVDLLDGSSAMPAAARGRTAPASGGRSFADAVQDALAAAPAVAGAVAEQAPTETAAADAVNTTVGAVAPPSAALPGFTLIGLPLAVDVAGGSAEAAGAGRASGLEPTASVPSPPFSAAEGAAEPVWPLGSGAVAAGAGDLASPEGTVGVTGPIEAAVPAGAVTGGTTAEAALPGIPPVSAVPVEATAAAATTGTTASSPDATPGPVPDPAQRLAHGAAPSPAGADVASPGPRDALPRPAPGAASADPPADARAEASVAPTAPAAHHSDAVVHTPAATQPAALALPLTPPTATTSSPDASTAAPARSVALPQQLAGPVLSLARSGDGEHRITLTVSPESLGPVTVRAHIAGGAIHIELHAPSDAGRDALRAVLTDLRRDLAAAAPHASLALASHDTASSSPGSWSPSGSAHPQSHGGGAQAPDRRAAREDPPHAPPAPAEPDQAAPAAGIDVYA